MARAASAILLYPVLEVVNHGGGRCRDAKFAKFLGGAGPWLLRKAAQITKVSRALLAWRWRRGGWAIYSSLRAPKGEVKYGPSGETVELSWLRSSRYNGTDLLAA